MSEGDVLFRLQPASLRPERRRTVLIFGVIILVGLVVARTFYFEAFLSVWCFFAAMASVAILLHFKLPHRSRLYRAGA